MRGNRPGVADGRRPLRQRAGMTLVELMIAIGVMLVAVSGSMASQISANRVVKTSRETTIAMTDLQACMEQAIALQSFEDGFKKYLFEQLRVPAGRVLAVCQRTGAR